MEVFNRKARYDYYIEDEIECGIALTGTEIKSIRTGHCEIKDSYALVRSHEVFIINMFIAPYKEGNIFNHEEKRTRKLLLHKQEIRRLENKISLQGYTLVPLKLYLHRNRVKILLGICKGKKDFDKRETIKERDRIRELAKSQKYRIG